jgi:predicted ribosomally synthesized peptide with nif11-like leader
MSQEDAVALLTRVRDDGALRARLLAATSDDAFEEVAGALGFTLRPAVWQDELTDAELDGISSEATDRTCHGTTDCCHTKRTCFGTTDCCR